MNEKEQEQPIEWKAGELADMVARYKLKIGASNFVGECATYPAEEVMAEIEFIRMQHRAMNPDNPR